MRKLILLAFAALALPGRAQAMEPLFDSAPLDDEELEEARGGFTLPGGIEIAFGAMITTTVGSDVALRTTMNMTDQGITYGYEPGKVNGQDVIVKIATSDAGSGGLAGTGIPGTNVKLDVDTANLFIRHMVGNQIGAIIANSADNQLINNEVAINLKLDNVVPLTVGSVAFQIESMGVDAASFRAP